MTLPALTEAQIDAICDRYDQSIETYYDQEASATSVYRVTADNTVQSGIVLGPGYITFEYSEAMAKAVEWREDPTLCNVVITYRHLG